MRNSRTPGIYPYSWPPGEGLRQACRIARKAAKKQQNKQQPEQGFLSRMVAMPVAAIVRLLVLLGIIKENKGEDFGKALESAPRPEYLPRMIAAAREGDRNRARYWLRRSFAIPA